MLSKLQAVLVQEYPEGIPFDNPMALRLLKQKVDCQDWQLEALKAKAFQLSNKLWYFPEQCCDGATQGAIFEQAAAWLEQYGFLSLGKIRAVFGDRLRNISSDSDFIVVLRAIHFIWQINGAYAVKATHKLANSQQEIAQLIEELIEDAAGVLEVHSIAAEFPHLDTDSLRTIVKTHLPEIYEAEENGLLFWRSSTSLSLPEDFSEVLTATVDQLIKLDFAPGPLI